MKLKLRSVVYDFVNLIHPLSVAELSTSWKWKGYNEGIRFANFRVFEELRKLSVILENERQNLNQPITMAQNILALHHQSYFDLRALLLGCGPEQFDKPMAKDEWTVRNTFQHMLKAEWSFFIAIETGLSRIKNKENQKKFTKEDWDKHFDVREGITDALFKKPLPQLLKKFDELHNQVQDAFAIISDLELEWKVIFWEEDLFPIRFRLHRFESHIRQHNIQIEKTLISIGHPLSEARTLCRRILNALAVVEGTMIGSKNIENTFFDETISEIENLSKIVEGLLA